MRRNRKSKSDNLNTMKSRKAQSAERARQKQTQGQAKRAKGVKAAKSGTKRKPTKIMAFNKVAKSPTNKLTELELSTCKFNTGYAGEFWKKAG